MINGRIITKNMNIMKQLLVTLVVLFAISMQCKAQSASDMADQIGIPGFWKMMSMSGKAEGEEFQQDLDGSSFYNFKADGTMLYTTSDDKIAKAKWTLKNKVLHVWGKDALNNPDGIDYTFKLVMVTPEKLVLKMGEDDEYVYTTFRKSNSTLKPVGKVIKRKTTPKRKK